jgi:hypothetical protein
MTYANLTTSDSGVAPAISYQPRQNSSCQPQSVPSTTLLPSPTTHRVSIGPQRSSNSDSSVPESPKTAHNSNSCPQCCVLRSPVIQLNDSLQKLLDNKYWGDHDCRVAANFVADILVPGFFWGSDRFGDMFEPALPMPPQEMKEAVARLLATYGVPLARTVSSSSGETGDIQSIAAARTSSSAQDQAQTQAVQIASSPTTVQEGSFAEPIYIT